VKKQPLEPLIPPEEPRQVVMATTRLPKDAIGKLKGGAESKGSPKRKRQAPFKG
jgi:hypothetical protein